MQKQNEISVNNINQSASHIKVLLYFGAIAGFIASCLIRRNLAAEFHILNEAGLFTPGLFTEPGSVLEWFEMFQSSWILGFLQTDFFDVVNSFLITVLLLGLFFLLRKESPVLPALAAGICIISFIFYVSSNISFQMLYLSSQYFAAGSTEGKRQLLAAGHSVLAQYSPGTGIKAFSSYTSLFFLFISGLIACLSMRSSPLFRKWVRIIGYIAHISGLFTFIVLPISPDLTAVPISLSAPFIIVWYFVIGLKLLNAAKGNIALEIKYEYY